MCDVCRHKPRSLVVSFTVEPLPLTCPHCGGTVSIYADGIDGAADCNACGATWRGGNVAERGPRQ